MEHSERSEATQWRERVRAVAGCGGGLDEHSGIPARLCWTEDHRRTEQHKGHREQWHGDRSEHRTDPEFRLVWLGWRTGWFGWIAKPLFVALRFTYDHVVPNWGWSILILTLVLNVAMLPTRITMMKSALKMQRIQPEMQQIKEKYKKYKATDPRRQDMNKEIMELQKREGVNMFGGCLPMLLQYPLLYGFYRMLMYAIELRQAHWMWLPDLSAPDALHILPIFVILTM